MIMMMPVIRIYNPLILQSPRFSSENERPCARFTLANLANTNNTLSAIPCNSAPNLHFEGFVWGIDDCVVSFYNMRRRSEHDRFASPKTSNPVKVTWNTLTLLIGAFTLHWDVILNCLVPLGASKSVDNRQ